MLNVKDNEFMNLDGEMSLIDSPEWFEALEAYNRFSYELLDTHITCRAESREGTNGRYWSAYKKVDGKTKKRYLGQTHNVTKEKLTEVVNQFISLSSHQVTQAKLPKVTQKVTQEVNELAIAIKQLNRYMDKKQFKKGGSSERAFIAYRRELERELNEQ